jgi:hypothetical protein
MVGGSADSAFDRQDMVMARGFNIPREMDIDTSLGIYRISRPLSSGFLILELKSNNVACRVSTCQNTPQGSATWSGHVMWHLHHVEFKLRIYYAAYRTQR